MRERACYNGGVSHGLAEVERALTQHGLLLEHDKVLPSVTAIVAGEPIAGSWWGHPLGHQIYDLLGAFAQRSGKLSTKVIDGKVTYVHERLWPAFFSVAQANVEGRLTRVTAGAAELYACVERYGPLRGDSAQVPAALVAVPRELTKATRALEAQLLVHSDSLHTDSGAHVKLLRTWPQWCAEHGVVVPALKPDAARGQLDTALAGLCRGTARKPKVPW